jgi:glucose-6-phosphate-specific signal transduction histidine kinase
MTKTRAQKSCLSDQLSTHRPNGFSASKANGSDYEELRQRLRELTGTLKTTERKLAEEVARHRQTEELLQESRAERERIRTVLHDSVGQVLTSLSFIATALRQKLTERNLPEAAEAQEIVDLANKAVAESRGLFPTVPVTEPLAR